METKMNFKLPWFNTHTARNREGDLVLVLDRLMPTITLDNISLDKGRLTLTGTAPNEEDIYSYSQAILQYARTLDNSGRYFETTVSSLREETVIVPILESEEESEEDEDTQEEEVLTQEEKIIRFLLTFERGAK